MTAKELAWIKRLEIATEREADKLTDFEKGFCRELFAKTTALGEKMKLSSKQWGVIIKISDKVIS